MLYTINHKDLGEVVLHMDTACRANGYLYVLGYDKKGAITRFVIDKICHASDRILDYGYCHIIAYSRNGICTECNCYQSLG